MTQKYKFCPYCGAKNDINDKFCVNCGKSLPTEDVKNSNISKHGKRTYSNMHKFKSHSSLFKWIIGGIVVLVVVLFMLGRLGRSSNSSNNNQSATSSQSSTNNTNNNNNKPNESLKPAVHIIDNSLNNKYHIDSKSTIKGNSVIVSINTHGKSLSLNQLSSDWMKIKFRPLGGSVLVYKNGHDFAQDPSISPHTALESY